MVVGYGVVVAGDFGTGRTLVARNVGLYAYRPFVHPPFYLTIASIFFFIDDCSKTEDKKFWSAGEYAGLTLFAVSNVS